MANQFEAQSREEREGRRKDSKDVTLRYAEASGSGDRDPTLDWARSFGVPHDDGQGRCCTFFASGLRWVRLRLTPLCTFAFASIGYASADNLPAFPGAEGFGALATGGRGGSVYHVTNLDNAGPGSLRDAVSQPNRVVVFDVGGVITLEGDQIKSASNITIAGETAPGEGITVYGRGLSFSGETNIIVRHLRIRSSITASRGSKTLNVAGGSNMIFDHLSISWGRWDNLGFTEKSSDITLQNCIVSEAIAPQNFGALIDSSTNITVARNLWISNNNRNPKGKAHLQYINNIVYNYGSGGYGGGHSAAEWNQDLINNLFIAGPNSKGAPLGGFSKTDLVCSVGNAVDLDKDGTLNPREAIPAEFRPMKAGDEPPTFKVQPFNAPKVEATVLPIQDVFDKVLGDVGASLKRDTIDERLIAEMKSLGTQGAIINDEKAVGGIQPLNGGTPRVDTDRDGIEDQWETAHGMNPNDSSDAMKPDESGYIKLEKYLHDLAAAKR